MSDYELNDLNTVLLPEFQRVTDKYGMIQCDGSTSDNGCLFTAHYVYGLIAKGLMTEAEKKRILRVYRNNFMEKGLLIRSPHDHRSEAQDDAYGLMSVEAMLFPNPRDRLMTKEIYEYGRDMTAESVDTSSKEPFRGVPSFVTKVLRFFGVKDEDMNRGWLNQKLFNVLKILGLGSVRWVWNQEKPRVFECGQWLGRFPQFIATMEMAQGKLVTPWRWLYWAGSMLALVYSSNPNNIDSYTLRIHSAKACQNYGPITKKICDRVLAAVKRDHGDFGGVCAKYFGASHPLVKLLSGVL